MMRYLPVAALLVGLLIGWRVESWRSSAVHNAELARLASAAQAAEFEARKTEYRRQYDIERVQTDASKQIEQARADARAADASADSLRKQAARLAGRACQNTGVTGSSHTTNSTAVVLADVLARIDARAGELAAAYDRARIAGLACEQSYRAIAQ
jgi:hypothetical protein